MDFSVIIDYIEKIIEYFSGVISSLDFSAIAEKASSVISSITSLIG